MLHREREPAVSYPKFPGNVEALSISVGLPIRRSSHESSSSSPSSSSTATTTPISPPPPTTTTRIQSPKPSRPSKARGKQTLAACHPCRKRKSKCDGARPQCSTCLSKATPCVYLVGQGKTLQQASREELRAYRAVVLMLRRASPQETEVILRHLRRHEDVNEAAKFIEADMMLRGAAVLSQA